MKYNYHELKHSGKELPEDINRFVEDSVKKNFPEAEQLLIRIVEARTGKKHRTITYVDKTAHKGVEIEVVDGMIPKFTLIKEVFTVEGGRLKEEDSVLNKNLDFSKPKK